MAASGEEAMETSVRKFFERYASVFKQALAGEIDMEEVASLYASDFIAASPAGVLTGKNGDQLKQVMEQGYTPGKCGYAMLASPRLTIIIAWPM
jgi:hypothetical protein